MEWVTYDNIRTFYSDTYDFLVAQEACNNLLLSLTLRLSEIGVSPFKTPQMFALKDQGEVLNCGFQVEPFNLILTMAPPKAFSGLAELLIDKKCQFPGVSGIAPGAESFVKDWGELTDERFSLYREQVVYEIQKVTPGMNKASGFMKPANINHINQVTEWLLNFGEASDIQGFDANHRFAKNMIEERRLFLWVDHQETVAMAAFGGDTPHGSRINAVYTAPEHRGRGYATSLVAELTELLLSLGRRSCFLFTEKCNSATRQLYEKIGYQAVCEAQEWKVDDNQTEGSFNSSEGATEA